VGELNLYIIVLRKFALRNFSLRIFITKRVLSAFLADPKSLLNKNEHVRMNTETNVAQSVRLTLCSGAHLVQDFSVLQSPTFLAQSNMFPMLMCFDSRNKIGDWSLRGALFCSS
jgi:hypothetical protein